MQYRILSVIRNTANASSFVLAPIDQEINYVAGQFITLIFKNRNNEEERRSYSISSAPLLKEPLRITVKKIPNGIYSRQLVDHARPGDVLQGLPPAGFFTLPEKIEAKQPFIFFAAGSGITPVIAQIKTLLHLQQENEVVLVYSNSSMQETIFHEELRTLAVTYPRLLKIHFLFSDAKHYKEARLSAPVITEIINKYFSDSIGKLQVYLCGPFQYMLMITLVLKGLGLKEAQIRKEQFEINKPIINELPPDTNAHEVYASIGEKRYQWSVQYPETILQSAKRQHIELPYSCESGQCGTCAALCASGEVWMFKNEVLMDDAIQQGKILTCTGYPVGGDVELRY